MRAAVLIGVAVAIAALAAGPARAFSDPTAIDWGAAEETFFDSLAHGLYGRPAAAAEQAQWRESLDGTGAARLALFRRLVTGSDFLKQHGDIRGDFALWRNDCPGANRRQAVKYAVAAERPGDGCWTPVVRKRSFEYATALMGWYQVYLPYAGR